MSCPRRRASEASDPTPRRHGQERPATHAFRCASYDTLRWHRLNQVPELSPLEQLQQAIIIKINAMAARGQLPAITGKNRLGNDLSRETLAEKLAWSLDQAYVFAARVRDSA